MLNTVSYSIDSLEIDDSKKLAINTTEGPLLIIAGPGSGKTKTLVERAVHLIANKNVPANRILISTFTEKAAHELVSRITQRLLELNINVNLNDMYIGTLHSIFLRFLEDYKEYTDLQKNYRVIDRFDQNYLVYKYWSFFAKIDGLETLVGRLNQWKKIEKIVMLVSKLGEEAVVPEDLFDSSISELTENQSSMIKTVGKIHEAYLKILEENNSLDFTTIQTSFLRLITEHPNVLEDIRNKIQYFMIDEYQDTNTIQEKLILDIIDPTKKNICVVGDDDQGLYRFRGATIRNILEFPSNFDGGLCKTIKLETNYRSHPGIIDFYNKWMNDQDNFEWGKFRYPKKIKPQPKEFQEYNSIIKVSGTSDLEWYHEVEEFLNTLKLNDNFTDLNQVAFLFRSVKHPRAVGLANYLEDRGIKVFSPRSALFFERDEIRLMIGALLFIFPSYFDSIKANNTWANNILVWYDECIEFFVDHLREDINKNKELIKWLQDRSRFFETFPQYSDSSFSSLFYELLKYPLFSAHLDVDLNQQVTDQRAAYNLALFSKLLTKFEYYENISVLRRKFIEKDFSKLLLNFFRFLIDGGLEEYEDFDTFAPSGCVSFMTVHQSKGLEFPITVIGSLYSSPRKQYTEIDEILSCFFYEKDTFEPLEDTKFFDFWRLFYTGFSRAKNLLVLTASERSGRGREPSSFFDFIYNPLPDWKGNDTELACIDYDSINQVDIKKQFSFTGDIILYENCPLQYKFFRELGFIQVRNAPTLFGLLVHQTIEDVHKAVLRKEPDAIGIEYENWFSKNYEGLAKLLGVQLAPAQKEIALKQVEKYIDKNNSNWERIVDCEVDVSHVEDDYILMGKIDLIRSDTGEIEILDFKTERDKPDINDPEDRKKLQRYRRQLEVYAHILEQRDGIEINRMHLYYTGVENANPYITWDRLDVDIDRTIQEVETVISKIECKNYNMTDIKIKEKQCENCDMRFYCKKR